VYGCAITTPYITIANDDEEQARPPTSFVDNASTCRVEIPDFVTKIPQGSTLRPIFGDTQISTVWDTWKEASMPKTSSIRPDVSIQYRLVTNGWADGRTQEDDSIYRASIASRGKKMNERMSDDSGARRVTRLPVATSTECTWCATWP